MIPWLCCLWLGLAMVAHTQRTYRRTCDCEYTIDGRCAYTLLLPAPAEGTKGQCPQVEGDKEGEGDREQLMAHVEQLKANVTDLKLVTGDQARMLSQLQSLLLTQQEKLNGLNGMSSSQTANPTAGLDSTPLNQATPSAVPPSTEGTTKAPCELCPQVEAELRQQQQVVQALQEQLNAIQSNLLNLASTLGNIGNRFPIEEITRQFEAQQNQTAQLQRSLAEMLLNATSSISPSELLPFACIRRGLLVSGKEKNITDDQITASSIYNDGHAAVRGRIFTMQEGDLMGAWCASK